MVLFLYSAALQKIEKTWKIWKRFLYRLLLNLEMYKYGYFECAVVPEAECMIHISWDFPDFSLSESQKTGS